MKEYKPIKVDGINLKYTKDDLKELSRLVLKGKKKIPVKNIKRKCLNCLTTFKISTWSNSINQKYCSQKCQAKNQWSTYRKGRWKWYWNVKFSSEMRKLRKTRLYQYYDYLLATQLFSSNRSESREYKNIYQ